MTQAIVENDRRLIISIFGIPIRLMVAVAFAAGTLIIALTAYTSVAERRREYGIVKAMGARGRFLAATAVRQIGVAEGLAQRLQHLGGGHLHGADRGVQAAVLHHLDETTKKGTSMQYTYRARRISKPRAIIVRKQAGPDSIVAMLRARGYKVEGP